MTSRTSQQWQAVAHGLRFIQRSMATDERSQAVIRSPAASRMALAPGPCQVQRITRRRQQVDILRQHRSHIADPPPMQNGADPIFASAPRSDRVTDQMASNAVPDPSGISTKSSSPTAMRINLSLMPALPFSAVRRP